MTRTRRGLLGAAMHVDMDGHLMVKPFMAFVAGLGRGVPCGGRDCGFRGSINFVMVVVVWWLTLNLLLLQPSILQDYPTAVRLLLARSRRLRQLSTVLGQDEYCVY